MQKFDELLRKFDLDFFGSGKHKMTIEKAMELKKEDKVFILDVRSEQENDYLKFEFATNIPTSEIPDRVQEIPKDKIVAIFCTSATRATIVYTYLKVAGYEDVKIITNNINDIAGLFKPGYVLKHKLK